MTGITSILCGIKEAYRQWRLVLTIYFIMTMMALTIGLQVYQVVEASIGHSIKLETLAQRFDYTIWRDFLNIHGASLSPLFGQLRWHILAFLVTSIFVHGGTLSNIRFNRTRWKDFWSGGAQYFGPFAGISLLYLVILLIWTMIIWMPFIPNLFPMIERFDRESPVIWILCALAIIWILGIGFLYSSSIFSRLAYMSLRRSVFSCIKFGMVYTSRKLKTSYFILAALLLSLVLIYFVNHGLVLWLGISSAALLLFFVIIQQLFVIIKIWLRVASMAALNTVLDERDYQD